MQSKEIVDSRGLVFKPLRRPFHVVSLVPSWTETLFSLGLTRSEIVGRTDYCIHPRARVGAIEKLGGPKHPDLTRILELDPDVIIMDREENRKEDVEEMEKYWESSRVFVTGPATVDQALKAVEKLGLLFNTPDRARKLVWNVRSRMDQLIKRDRGSVAYLTWRDPFIVATRETYIGDVLRILGYQNIFDRSSLRDFDVEGSVTYPTIRLELLIRLKPKAILLATEPFPFRAKHIRGLRSDLRHLDAGYAESVEIRVVNGEYFSWYGSRMILAFGYFVRKQTRL